VFTPTAGHTQLLTRSDRASSGFLLYFDTDQQLLGKEREKAVFGNFESEIFRIWTWRRGQWSFITVWKDMTPSESLWSWLQPMGGMSPIRFREPLGPWGRGWAWRPYRPLQDRKQVLWYCESRVKSSERTAFRFDKIHWSPDPKESRMGEWNSHRTLGTENF
jgi:hypothetical protein